MVPSSIPCKYPAMEVMGERSSWETLATKPLRCSSMFLSSSTMLLKARETSPISSSE